MVRQKLRQKIRYYLCTMYKLSEIRCGINIVAFETKKNNTLFNQPSKDFNRNFKN